MWKIWATVLGKDDDNVFFLIFHHSSINRGLFIIDKNGILRQITMNDLPVGRSVDETLRLVQAFQYTDQHGEVCPANWKPGSETIIPDPKEKLLYFEKFDDTKSEL